MMTTTASSAFAQDLGGGGDECELPPSCRVIPSDSVIEAIVGVPFSMTICGVSNCGNEVSIESWRFNPGWCPEVSTTSRGENAGAGEEICIDLICTPPLTALIGGPRTFKFKITDTETGEEAWCEFKVNVSLPPCISKPHCRTIPEGVIEVNAGDSFSFDFCASSECADHRFAILPVSVPEWCRPAPGMMDRELDMPEGERCFTIECNPPRDTPPDRYWIKIKIIDLETGFQDICVLDVDIVEPPCDDPPTCDVRRPFNLGGNDSARFEIIVGETGGFQICGTSPCGNDIMIMTDSLPDFCEIRTDGGCEFCGGDGGHKGDHTECIWIDCEPGPKDVGKHNITFRVVDQVTEGEAQCRVSINVEPSCETEPPTCDIFLTGDLRSGHSDHEPWRVQVGEPFEFTVCGDAICDDHSVRVAPSGLPPFVTNPGHRNGGPGEEVCLDVRGEARSRDIGTWNIHFEVTDIDNNLQSDCWKKIIVEGEPQCEEPPTCSIEPAGLINATPGATLSLEICGAPICQENAVSIVAEILPDFCDPFETIVGEVGEMVCGTLTCTVPMDVSPGTYHVQFRITDTTNGRSDVCTAQLVVPEPEQLGCFEGSESNDNISECSTYDAGDCFDIGCGSSISGLLDQTGSDLDYYCVGGLDPFSTYSVSIIGGLDMDGMPGCYALACIAEDGSVINSTNSGQAMGFPSIECSATFDGFVFFAVSGCDDLNFDGQQDPVADERGGIGHGSRGSYVLAVSFADPIGTAQSCHADMNGDGVIDAGDLGMLIGMFGETCTSK